MLAEMFHNRQGKICRNRSHSWAALTVTLALCAGSSAFGQTSTFFAQYCTTCHSNARRVASLTLEGIDLTAAPDHAETVEKVISKLRATAMPPPGMRQPPAAERGTFIASLETALDRAAAARPNAGRPAPHRLNRTEYVNAIRDLLALEINGAELPPDDSGFGFDNIADVLSVSPMLTERYLSAARRISRLAVGDPALRPSTESYSVDKYFRQDDRANEDLPFGSRGGIAVHYYFPVDAQYSLKIFFLRTYDGRIRGFGEANEVEVLLNGEKLQQFTVGGGGSRNRNEEEDGREVKFQARAGPGIVAVTFAKSGAAAEGTLRPAYAVTSYEFAGDISQSAGIARVELGGPYETTGPGDSPSRRRIFVCRPAGSREEDACAKRILSTLARRAYRRPVAETDLESLLGFYRAARQSGSFDAGIQSALRRILVSPDFLFRLEPDPDNAHARVPYRLNDLELASRLSFFLWSSIPDDQLLNLAAGNKLHDPRVLEQQVARMLADRRSQALMTNFAGQWLYLRNVRLVSPDPYAFPEFDDNLRQAFARETELFLDSQFREDHSVLDLLTANYTFVNERLARHYGIPGVYGSHFRRVTLGDDNRRGLLGKGAILTVTSYANRTSPVLRGKWLLENILGAPPPPPPPNVPTLKENTVGSKPLSVRERLEEHRKDPVCASCHRVMDPLGFALENFDAIGKWRVSSEAGTPIDASGALGDGTPVDGPATLRDALLKHREEFVSTVTRKLLTYALGRGAEYYDEPAVREIVRDGARGDYRWSSLVLGIVKSVPFQMKMPESLEQTAADRRSN